MTGKMIFDKAMMLLGYTGRTGELAGGDELLSRSLAILNAVYADLYYLDHSEGFTPLTEIQNTLQLSEQAANETMPYGVAMHLAAGEGDGDNQQLFSYLYNQKRTALSYMDKRCDVLPMGADEE